MSKITMSWGDRFALIEHFKPSDDQVCAAFGLSQDELDTARMLRDAGTFQASSNVDYTKYANVFTINADGTSAYKQPAEAFIKPESASKPVRAPQKRGRKGDKIVTALCAVPTTQVPVSEFMAEHKVSLAVLRQSKRFMAKLDAETASKIGRINVRQDKQTKQLMIWRELPTD